MVVEEQAGQPSPVISWIVDPVEAVLAHVKLDPLYSTGQRIIMWYNFILITSISFVNVL